MKVEAEGVGCWERSRRVNMVGDLVGSIVMTAAEAELSTASVATVLCVVDGWIDANRLVLVVLGVAFRGLNWTVRGGLQRIVPRSKLESVG